MALPSFNYNLEETMIESKFGTLKSKIADRRRLKDEVTNSAANMTLEEKSEIEGRVASLDVEITALVEEFILEPMNITKD